MFFADQVQYKNCGNTDKNQTNSLTNHLLSQHSGSQDCMADGCVIRDAVWITPTPQNGMTTQQLQESALNIFIGVSELPVICLLITHLVGIEGAQE